MASCAEAGMPRVSSSSRWLVNAAAELPSPRKLDIQKSTQPEPVTLLPVSAMLQVPATGSWDEMSSKMMITISLSLVPCPRFEASLLQICTSPSVVEVTAVQPLPKPALSVLEKENPLGDQRWTSRSSASG